jgi:hypothetical protein
VTSGEVWVWMWCVQEIHAVAGMKREGKRDVGWEKHGTSPTRELGSVLNDV